MQLYFNSTTDEVLHSGSQVYECPDPQTGEDTVGKPLPHRWAQQCTSGEAVYIDDIRPSEGN